MKRSRKYRLGDLVPSMCRSIHKHYTQNEILGDDKCNVAFELWCMNCKYGILREFASNDWPGCRNNNLDYVSGGINEGTG